MLLFNKSWFHNKAVGNEGYLYVISNPSMPGLIKVGMTSKTPAERLQSLYSTSVPTPFEAEYFALCRDRKKSEALAHRALSDWRVSSKREFFRLSPEQAITRIHPVIGNAKLIYTRRRIARLCKLCQWLRATVFFVALGIP